MTLIIIVFYYLNPIINYFNPGWLCCRGNTYPTSEDHSFSFLLIIYISIISLFYLLPACLFIFYFTLFHSGTRVYPLILPRVLIYYIILIILYYFLLFCTRVFIFHLPACLSLFLDSTPAEAGVESSPRSSPPSLDCPPCICRAGNLGSLRGIATQGGKILIYILNIKINLLK
jgi:hypothetical protein